MPLKRLKAKLASQDYVSKTAIVLDENAETSAVIKVNEVRVIAFMIDTDAGIMHINFVLGGRDSNGKFHKAAQYQPALWTLHREQQKERWDQLLSGKTSFSFTDFLQWLHDGGGVKMAGRNIWNLPDLESEVIE